MTDPLVFPTTTPRRELPLLVAGQAQKEFFVNEAFARIDALLHPVVEGERASPPADPVAGESWLVGTDATGPWAGQEGALASWDGTQWTLCRPDEGLAVFDRSASATAVFRGDWQRVERPAPPQGGSVIDTEARAAIAVLVDKLATVGIFPRE